MPESGNFPSLYAGTFPQRMNDGVFGNLPSTRPGSRSPRRRADPAESEQPKGSGETEPKPAPEAPAPSRAKAKPAAAARETPPAEPQPDPPAEPQSPAAGIHGVEDLAWAGVAVAAQTATAGVRFASRALEAARKSIDRP